jgi:hypothetical protein
MSMAEMLTDLTMKGAPFALGLSIGFCVAVFGLWRWFSEGCTEAGRDIFSAFRRMGFRYVAVGLLLTAAAGHWLSTYLPGHSAIHTIQGALWGLPFGLAVGVRWVFLRGLR